MAYTPEDRLQENALMNMYVQVKQSSAAYYAFAAIREPESTLWKESAVREARDLRDALNKFLEEMKAVEIQLEAAE